MALNPSIILSGQQFDLAGAMQNGLNMATQQKQFDQQNALANLYKTQGAGIVAGDPNAINALAQFDPAAALGIQNTHQQMQYREEDQVAQREKARQEAIEYAKTVSAEELAAQTAELTAALAGGSFYHQNGDRAGYDSFLRSKGIDPAQYTFDDFPAHAAEFEPVLEAWKSFAPPEAPKPMSPEGKLAADAAAGFVPQGTVATPNTVVNVGGEGDAFYKKLDEAAAAMFSTLQTEGIQAGRTLGLIDRLDQLMQETPTGGVAALTRLAGEVGIDVGGLGNVQAVNALINQIVPQQRQPGSGPMSDADLALFKQSVPRLINSPEGNAIIVQTMRGINEYVQQQAAIADMVANREITPAEGRNRLKALVNPLDGFNAGTGKADDKAVTPKGPTVVDGFTIEAIE